MAVTDGQRLALEELEAICDHPERPITIVNRKEPNESSQYLTVHISIATGHLVRSADGLQLRKRELLQIHVPPRYPREIPFVKTPHMRFAGFPHVLVGNQLCLYAAPDLEWTPNRGMFGFMDRLHDWLAAAARNALDPTDAPLHPPFLRFHYRMDIFVVLREDTPKDAENAPWFGFAKLKRNLKDRNRYDLVAWTAEAFLHDTEHIGAITILLNEPFPFEYPNNVRDLFECLVRRSVNVMLLCSMLKNLARGLDSEQPLLLVLGTPMRRKEFRGSLKHHLAIWKIDRKAIETFPAIDDNGQNLNTTSEPFLKWFAAAKVEWIMVDEARDEVTNRRDIDSQLFAAADKSVLLLGCGALGSHVAEFLVRAGVRSLTLVDKGCVSAGLLVRQQFDDGQIGKHKAFACRDRIAAIAPTKVEITPFDMDITKGVFSRFDLSNLDLIIDATASSSVSHVIEEELQHQVSKPPILAMAVSAMAQIGRVAVRPRNALGAHRSIIRRAQIRCHADPKHSDLVRAFWPSDIRKNLFQPEPGCSSPTFQGSAADMAYHASNLLNLGLEELTAHDTESTVAMFLPRPTIGRISPNCRRFVFEKPESHVDERHGYSIHCSPAVAGGVVSEISRSSRVNGSECETGGFLFGEVNDGLRMIWIDSVSGPPPDSEFLPERFVCGTEGAMERADFEREHSGGASDFIGTWHTHPISNPLPSPMDLQAVLEMLTEVGTIRRHTVMLIIGNARTDAEWAFYLYRRNDLREMRERQPDDQRVSGNGR